jgi:hypothetical protein
MYDRLTTFDCPSSGNYIGNVNNNAFPRPFLDYASPSVPQTFAELLDWSEYAFLATGDYKSIFEKLYNYFITDLRLRSVDVGAAPLDETTTEDWRSLLENKLSLREVEASMGLNLSIYGNDFLSVYVPIRRYLDCPACGGRIEIKTLARSSGSDFAHRDGKFTGRCVLPACVRAGNRGTQIWGVTDMRSSRPEDFKIKQWPVREMVVHHYAMSDRTIIYWRIPEHYKRAVSFGDIETLAEADLAVLEAIHKNMLFRFRDDRIFHAKEPTITGLQTRGWGLPRTIFMNRQGWTVQMLRRNTQGLAADWIMPIKIVSPSASPMRAGNGLAMTPSTQVNHTDFARMFGKVASNHRANPTGWHALQMPVDANILGGDATRLFPAEMIRHAKDELIDAGGLPVEMYRSTLTIQTTPVALRLFEATHQSIPGIYNRLVAFLVNRISELSSRDPIHAKHEKVTIIDDIELMMAKLQMATAGQLSMTEPLRRMGISYRDDVRQQQREQDIMLELQEERQNEQVQRQQSMSLMAPQPGAQPGAPQGQAGAPADPTAGLLPSSGYVPPMLPDEMEAAATALAQTLSMMPPMQRQQELKVLRERHKTFHGIVRVRLEQADQANAQQGRMMMVGG